jgi:predicted neuraminidase
MNASSVLVAGILVLGFALSGWKLWQQTPPSSFKLPAGVVPASTASPPSAGGGLKASTAAVQKSPDGRFTFDAGFVSASPGQAVHAASLVELRDGRLRAVWFSGSREGAGDVSVQTSVMDPVSLKWAPESTLIERRQLQRGLWRYVKKIGNPVIARAPDGALVLWMVNVSLGGWAGSSISWVRSTDEGETWSLPRRLVTSPFLNVSTLVKAGPVAMANGDVSLPVYHEFIAKFGEVLRINSDGQVVGKVRITDSQSNLQPVLLAISPGRGEVYLRSGTAQALMTSETTDAGKSWSPTRATDWPNPDSAVGGLMSFSQVRWLALNPAARNRDVLELLSGSAVSGLEGARSWIVESSATPKVPVSTGDFESLLSGELLRRGADPAQAQAYVASAKRQLCNGGSCAQEFSYPFLLQSRDGYIHLVYTWHRTRIKHVRFNPTSPLEQP